MTRRKSLTLKKRHIISAVFTVIVGSSLHFLFELFGQNHVVGSVVPVNESTWEHLKLLFTPVFIATLAENAVYAKKCPGFLPARTLSVFSGMFCIVALFYTYTGIIGFNFLVADIGTFVAGVALTYIMSYHLTSKGMFLGKSATAMGWISLFALLILFIIFTFYPPHIPLFQAPNSGLYGII